MTQLQRVIYQTVHASVDEPTIFVIVSGTVRGERRFFARDVVTHRTARTPDEVVVGTVWRGAFTPAPALVS